MDKIVDSGLNLVKSIVKPSSNNESANDVRQFDRENGDLKADKARFETESKLKEAMISKNNDRIRELENQLQNAKNEIENKIKKFEETRKQMEEKCEQQINEYKRKEEALYHELQAKKDSYSADLQKRISELDVCNIKNVTLEKENKYLKDEKTKLAVELGQANKNIESEKGKHAKLSLEIELKNAECESNKNKYETEVKIIKNELKKCSEENNKLEASCWANDDQVIKQREIIHENDVTINILSHKTEKLEKEQSEMKNELAKREQEYLNCVEQANDQKNIDKEIIDDLKTKIKKKEEDYRQMYEYNSQLEEKRKDDIVTISQLTKEKKDLELAEKEYKEIFNTERVEERRKFKDEMDHIKNQLKIAEQRAEEILGGKNQLEMEKKRFIIDLEHAKDKEMRFTDACSALKKFNEIVHDQIDWLTNQTENSEKQLKSYKKKVDEVKLELDQLHMEDNDNKRILGSLINKLALFEGKLGGTAEAEYWTSTSKLNDDDILRSNRPNFESNEAKHGPSSVQNGEIGETIDLCRERVNARYEQECRMAKPATDENNFTRKKHVLNQKNTINKELDEMRNKIKEAEISCKYTQIEIESKIKEKSNLEVMLVDIMNLIKSSQEKLGDLQKVLQPLEVKVAVLTQN